MSAQYWVAQHIDDLFRNEPRNVGVLVRIGQQLAARFFGEDNNFQMDRRKLRAFAHQDVYRQWVDFWRGELAKGTGNLSAAMSGKHYRIVDGGELTDIHGDAVADVLNYLYALLVSEGGLEEALRTEDVKETGSTTLERELASAFQGQDILADAGKLFVPHPVRRGIKLPGTQSVQHTPAFVQDNGQVWVMETVDFTTRQRYRSRDHAGWSAYMFRDLRNQDPRTEAIAIVKVTEADAAEEEVGYGQALLQNEARIVNWLEPKERKSFLDERRIAAFAK